MKNKIKYISIILAIVLITCAIIASGSSVFADSAASLVVNSGDTMFNHFSSSSYLLMDMDSGKVLSSFNENEKRQVASICKLMTTLLVLEQISSGKLGLDDEMTASVYASEAEGSQAFLDAGSKYKVKELLKSVIVASANDSAIVLAEGISGSEKLFVEQMNKRAAELGMTNTHYENSTGLETPNQHSSALDTAIILKEVSEFDVFLEDCSIWMDKLVHPSGRETELVNTNRLIRYYDKCKAGKTGFTDEAGYCLASYATDEKLNLIAVTLNSKNAASRFKENMDLYSYGFANFENQKVLDSSLPINHNVKINFGKSETLQLGYAKDYFVISNKNETSDITTHFELPKKLKAPVNKGDKVGVCIVLKNGVVIDEVDVISLVTIDKHNFKDVIRKIADDWNL